MRAGWDPTRRNRNIGTAKRGHGENNKFVIPSSRHDLNMFWGQLSDYRAVSRPVHGKRYTLLVEATRRASVHPCTVDDLFHILGHVPASDLADITFLILRQPKRKEEVVSPCWGRLAYGVVIDEYEGPTIILEASEFPKRMRWDKSMRPDEALELERLREDGHKITTTRRHHIVECTQESARATQLYRTLLHEIGHWVHYLDCVECPAAATPYSWQGLFDRYHSKPVAEKEAFAHGYASSMRAQLMARRVIPFERRLDIKRLKQDGLSVDDFVTQVRNG